MGIYKWIIRKRYNLPKILKKEWLAAGVHMKDKALPPVWDEDENYIDINIGDIMPMEEVGNGLFAYYEVVKSYRKGGGDYLYDTDRYHYDMEFTHVGEFKIRWN